MERVISLLDAIPYVRAYEGQTFVIKAGGELLLQPKWRDGIARDLCAIHRLGIRVVLVHGGGPQLDDVAQQWGIDNPKVNGRRVTSTEMLDAALMVWRGRLSSMWVQAFAKQGESAVGVCGFDGNLITAERRPPVRLTNEAGDTEEVDFGHVGDICSVRVELLESILSAGSVPVISPLAGSADGSPLNVNADTIASELAIHLKAAKLIMLTRAPGVLADPEDDSSVLHWADIACIEQLKNSGVLSGGMLPKMAAAAKCLRNGVARVHIVDGRRPGALLEEVFTTEGSGTLLVERSDACPAEPLGMAPVGVVP
jgi:acetylglutamate kinase